ncbi:MAG: type IV pilus secretin PilQ family protein [Nitrosomonadaceae bacterium]|nr:type IV pilus secretin PilQ family protein [Nitrosomonadaceae bacterium]
MNTSTVMNRYVWLGCTLLLAILLPPAIAADTEPVAAAQYNIEDISVSAAQGNLTVVKVTMNQPLTAPPVGISLSNSDSARIYFDFLNTSNALGKNILRIDEGGVRSLNIVQVGGRTRLVVNLSRSMNYVAAIEDKVVLITLRGMIADPTATGSTTHFAEVKSDRSQLLSLRDVEFRRGADGEGLVQVDLSNAGIGIDVRQQGKNIIVEFIQASLPRNLERRLDVVDFATPVQTIETLTHGENVRMVIESKGLWEHSAYQTDAKFILKVKPVAEDLDRLANGKSGRGGFKGDKLSLNFQNVDVRAVLQVIADFTGLNIITSDTVTGNLTLRLKDVPWDQALDIMLQAKGLGQRQVGNVILIAPRDEIATKEKLDLESRQQISDLEPIYTESFQMSYQKADVIRTMLADPVQKMLSKRGSVAMDARTNTLFVRDTPTQLEELRKLLVKIDIPVRQVMIEARIVEAVDTFSRNLGARFGVQNATQIGNRNLGISGTQAGSSDLAAGGSSSGSTLFNNVNMPALGAAGAAAALGGPFTLGLSLIKINNGTLVNLELSALETDGRGKVIASPRIVTADQVEATIEQGSRIPFQQATSSGATSVVFRDATLRLKVTPQITPDNNVIMNLNVNQDSIGTITATGVPTINTKQITTQVLVENGGTVVIGGIFSRDENTLTNRVPLLGDIPLLGNVFRNNARRDNKTELLIFVTPRILKDSLNMR